MHRLSNFLFSYLEKDHFKYCRPDDVGAGGLAALPITKRYFDGKEVPGEPRNFSLPHCPECKLNGSMAYHAILGYFTTKNIHPNEVHELGKRQLSILYPQVKPETIFFSYFVFAPFVYSKEPIAITLVYLSIYLSMYVIFQVSKHSFVTFEVKIHISVQNWSLTSFL